MKTMEINELVSELKEYDGELTVKVWNNGADKAYPISHVGQGHTDGVLDTYVSIVVDDDRNLVDLSKVWHDANENPRAKEWIIVQFGEDNYGTMSLSDFGAKMWCNSCKILRWAYITDLLPKGGAK